MLCNEPRKVAAACACALASNSSESGDSLRSHNGMAFSTPDKDHDAHVDSCASQHRAGWWFKSCYDSNLNGAYRTGTNNNYRAGADTNSTAQVLAATDAQVLATTTCHAFSDESS